MAIQHELKAYEAKTNLPLFNDIAVFVMDTAEASPMQRAGLYDRCPFLYLQDGAFQEKYGFLYLGELLERYEERFGMAVQDLRAIAQALGYTRDLQKKEMFVGSQKEDFLRKVQQDADGDIYLAGALYLLEEGRSNTAERELRLTAAAYAATEDLLFAVSLFQDHKQAFLHFKPQLIRLLGKERTMPVLGNATVLNWLVTWLMPRVKAARGKDMALFRALCTLPVSHVKPGSKPHDALLGLGYTPLEIAYLNMMAILSQTAEGVRDTDSIVSEKVAVSLFHEALVHEEALDPEIYDQLAMVYRLYEHFQIRCYGEERLIETLKDDTRIQNAETFLWFSKQAIIYHPVFSGFDVMNRKWDSLAKSMEPEKYVPLFEAYLSDGMSQKEIQSRLVRYRELTGKNYADIYWTGSRGNRFELLVNKGILDLWELFENSLDKAGNIEKPDMLANIRRYAGKIPTMQAYRFFERFFHDYGTEGLERFFGGYRSEFYDGLTERQSYYYGSQDSIKLKFRRDYLDDAGHRKLLHWLEEYIFAYQPEQYLALVTEILKDDFASGLFAAEEQRALFDLTVKQPDISYDTRKELQRRYLTEAELQSERDAEDAASRNAEQRKQEALVQGIRVEYGKLLDGSLASVTKFLNHYRYYRRELPVACRIVRESLDGLLDAKSYELDSQEAVWLLYVCYKLVKENAMSFSEAQKYITKIEERVENDTGNLFERRPSGAFCRDHAAESA